MILPANKYYKHFSNYDLYSDTPSERFLLKVGVSQSGQLIHPLHIDGEYSFWPNCSAFLSILEKYRYHKRIDFSNIQTFFECGSSYGQTSISMSKFFNVQAVEILPGIQSKVPGLKYGINWIEGNATDELKKFLIKNPNERLIILLDDHTPEYDCWILEELEVIKNYSNINNHIILVDDFDHFGKYKYPTFEHFASKLKQINKDYKIEDPDIRDVSPYSYVLVCYV